MGFYEFITNFRYRRRLEAELERHRHIKPPAKPSRRYIDRLVHKLLDQRTAWNARRELELIGPAVAPSLVAALEDPRFLRAEWETPSLVPAPLESTLELLVRHAPDDVVRIASPLIQSTSLEVRRTLALQLATSGRASAIRFLQTLMQDNDGYVRSRICAGLHHAMTDGRPDDDFRRQAYDLLLTQLDQDWGDAMNDAADTMALLDPARAAIDLANERWLSLSNPKAYRILEACNHANILLPEAILRRLLEATLPQAVGNRCFPNDYVAAAALRALALRHANDVEVLAQSLLNHEREAIQAAAADALAVVAGVSDPTGFVVDRVSKQGYSSLSREQRVVYCAFLFDAEVCNGGLMQFFGNSSGDHAADTLEALAELGQKEAHATLQAAMRVVGPASSKSDRELRLRAFEGRWDELQLAFDPLQRAYDVTKVRLRQAWRLYAVRHAEHFRA